MTGKLPPSALALDEPLAPPDRNGILGEALGLVELPRLLLRWPALSRAPRGEGRPVLVLPGFGAGDGSTAVLRAVLRQLGHRTYGWGLGRNDGDVPTLLGRAAARLAELADRRGEPVALVGWSLGGYLARELARDDPERVRRVVTLGSPVVGGPKYTAVASVYRGQGIDLDAIEAEVDARYAQPLLRPVTAIYSRGDRVVAWRACIDRRSPDVEHVEVQATHLGLGFAPEVLEIVARRLAAEEEA